MAWDRREKTKRMKWPLVAACFFQILILSLAITAMILTGGNLDDFYRGKTSQVDQRYLNNYSCSGMVYSEESSMMELTESDASNVLFFLEDVADYTLLELNMRMQSGEKIELQLAYYDRGGAFLAMVPEVISVENGQYYIPLSETQPGIYRIRLYMQDQIGKTFWIESARLLEQVQQWSTGQFLGLTLAWCIILSVLLGLIYWLGRKRERAFGTAYLDGARKVMAKAFSKIEPPAAGPAVWVGRARTLLFAIMLLILQYLDMGGQVLRFPQATLRFVVCSIVVLLISILSRERGSCFRKQKGTLLKLWTVMGMICMCSEFVVEKRIWGRGVFMLFVMGFFFYAWSCMKQPERMLLDLTRGIEITFWLNIGYCLMFVPVTGQRYVGFTDNSNVFMMYLLPELVAVLMGIYRGWMEQKGVSVAVRAVGLGIGIYYLNRAASRTGLLGVILAIIIVIISVMLQWKRSAKEQKILFGGAFILTVAGVFLAHVIGTGMEVYAIGRFLEQIKNSESFDQFSSGRLSIYIRYLGQMNLWGHEYREVFGTVTYDAHNGVLTMGYLYGILAIVPYCAWLLAYIREALVFWRKRLRDKVFAIFPLLTVSAMAPVLLVENLEQFLRWPVWILYYFTVGILFQNETDCEG